MAAHPEPLQYPVDKPRSANANIIAILTDLHLIILLLTEVYYNDILKVRLPYSAETRVGTNTRHMVDMGQGLSIKPLRLPTRLHVLGLRALPPLLGIRFICLIQLLVKPSIRCDSSCT